MPTPRYQELKRILTERRREILADIREQRRRVSSRSEDKRPQTTNADEPDLPADADEIELAIIQMKTATENGLCEALVRLDEGNYGNCCDCGDEIHERRLRAIPFAVRCKDCEERREAQQRKERFLAIRRPGSLRLDS